MAAVGVKYMESPTRRGLHTSPCVPPPSPPAEVEVSGGQKKGRLAEDAGGAGGMLGAWLAKLALIASGLPSLSWALGRALVCCPGSASLRAGGCM